MKRYVITTLLTIALGACGGNGVSNPEEDLFPEDVQEEVQPDTQQIDLEQEIDNEDAVSEVGQDTDSNEPDEYNPCNKVTSQDCKDLYECVVPGSLECQAYCEEDGTANEPECDYEVPELSCQIGSDSLGQGFGGICQRITEKVNGNSTLFKLGEYDLVTKSGEKLSFYMSPQDGDFMSNEFLDNSQEYSFEMLLCEDSNNNGQLELDESNCGNHIITGTVN
ncbi:hypothetical protein HOK51_08990 [Candidatus Woesearchaeota archaeon]|jgi:hypothetical protein|nr:hypothetical protein [Candidatus Woesearchaeota archaeon]MBT6519964.1 hypothetical protein [Candidatus Woesearchaeota archaeon]MBT7367835.1 hypothetical protein [Candidatus Woesearchaeota archaeon]